MDLLAMNVSMSKVNEVIRTVLQKLGRKSISRLPSKAVHSHLPVKAKHPADVQLGRAMLEEADPSRVIGNTLHGDGTTKYHRHFQDFEVTTPYCQTYSIFLRPMLVTCSLIHFHICFTKLKIYHHSFFHIQWAFLSWGSQTQRQSWMPSRRVEEIAQAIISGDERASVENKFAE